jgi:L-arabinokinase
VLFGLEMDEVNVSITGTEQGLTARTEQFLQLCEQCWPAGQEQPRIVTWAPGRLDCIGGMASFSGALALQTTIEPGVHVAVGRRNDQQIHVQSIAWDHDGEPASHQWPLAYFYESDGQIVTADRLQAKLSECSWARHVAGICLALLESGDVPHFAGGITLLLHSDIPPERGLASSAAIQVASAWAIGALFEADLTPDQITRACQAADQQVVGSQVGLVDHHTCLLGEPDCLLQIRCQPDDVLGVFPLPKGVKMIGIDTGPRLPIYKKRYNDNRVASLMGHFLIEQMIKLNGQEESQDIEGGYLANIPPHEYVRQFRNELPVKLIGKDFIDHFGQPEELDITIKPGETYKVRSRTEHHIYENDRTHRFIERLSRARRTGERDALVEAGELMYASHWSYSQRCGMGSIHSDLLVNEIRDRGPARGLYGAKITGGGCGGAIAVLIADTPQAREALEEATASFSEKSGQQANILEGSAPGARNFGHRVLH